MFLQSVYVFITPGMTCQARSSYLADEVQWGHRFSPMMSLAEGFFDIDYGAFHQTFEVRTHTHTQHSRKAKSNKVAVLAITSWVATQHVEMNGQ